VVVTALVIDEEATADMGWADEAGPPTIPVPVPLLTALDIMLLVTAEEVPAAARAEVAVELRQALLLPAWIVSGEEYVMLPVESVSLSVMY